jgi:WD40 repeat protein
MAVTPLHHRWARAFAGLLAACALPLSARAALRVESSWQASSVLLQYVEFAPDAALLVTADGGGVGQLWTTGGQSLAVLKGQRAPMFRAHFSSDGKQLVTSGYDGSAWVWSPSGQLLQRLQVHRAATADVFLLPATPAATAALVSGSDDGTVVLHNRQGELLWSAQFSGTTRQLRPNATATLIAASSDNGQIHLVTPAADRRSATVRSFQTPHGRINLLRFSPDQRQLAAAGTDGTVSLSALNGTLQRSLKATDSGWARGMSFCGATPKASLLTVGDDGTLRQWSPQGQLLASLSLSPKVPLTAVDCNANGRQAAVVNAAGQLWLLAVTAP